MRLESLELDQPHEARDELAELASRLSKEGFSVTIAEPGESVFVRLRESAEHVFVDVLNVVLDEAECHAIDVVISAVTAWATRRVHFRGREGARPVVVVWVVDEDVREFPLPDPKRDVARIRDTERWPRRPWLPVVRALADGDREPGLIYDEDVAADSVIRVFGTTVQSEQALMAESVIDGSQLPLRHEYDSLERMLADGWSVD